jgi:hypothetical protein
VVQGALKLILEPVFEADFQPGSFGYTYIEYARFADNLVILIDAYKRHDWLVGAVDKRLREEFGKLQVEINDEKSRTVDLERGECLGFLGFEFRYLRGLSGAMRPHYTPKLKSGRRWCGRSKRCSADTGRNRLNG